MLSPAYVLHQLLIGSLLPDLTTTTAVPSSTCLDWCCMQALVALREVLVAPGQSEANVMKERVCNTMLAVREGKLKLTVCFVMNLPFHTEGDLVPVRLPCGCTMSWAGSRIAVRQLRCPLCTGAVPENADCPVATRVLRLVQVERRGFAVPEIERSRLTSFDRLLGKGSQGEVYKGEWRSEDGTTTQGVAIKKIIVPQQGLERMPRKDVADLEQVVATTFLAARSRHVCKMHGVSWGDEDVWCATAFPHTSHDSTKLAYVRCNLVFNFFIRE